jgi:nitroreductase
MLEILEAITTRRSIRSYNNEAVSRDVVEKLLEAAVMAPSGSNLQPWAFVVLQDKAVLKKYSDQAKTLWLERLKDRPDPQNYKELLSNRDFNLFYNAGTLIIIYGESANYTHMIDCTLAAQNMMLAAHAQGLGTCWIGFSTAFFNSNVIKQELGVPATFEAVAPVIVGYPAEGARRDPSRKPAPVLAWK